MARRQCQHPVGFLELADHFERVARLLRHASQLIFRHVDAGLEREGVEARRLAEHRRTGGRGRRRRPVAPRALPVAAVMGVERQVGEVFDAVGASGSFEHVDHAAMECATGAVGETAVHDPVIRVVAEAHDARPDAFEEAVQAVPPVLAPDQRVVTHPSEQGDVDLRPEHRRVPEQLAIGWLERVDARLDQRFE